MATKYTSIKGSKFTIQYDKDFEYKADWLLEVIRLDLMDKTPVDGHVVCCAWFSMILKQKNNGDFLVYTPDLEKNPFVDVTLDLSDSLYIHSFQLDFSFNQGVPPLFTSFNNTLTCVKDCFSYNDLVMTRSIPNDNDSGWFIGLKESNLNVDQHDSNNLDSIYAYELLELRPELLQVLYLPQDFIVRINESGIESIKKM